MHKVDLTKFDYQKVADLDSRLWRLYAHGDRGPVILFFRAFALIKYQLGFSWIVTVRLGHYATGAAIGYRLRKEGSENYARSQKYLTKLFKTISEASVQPFDIAEAARLELEWWDIQRYPKRYKKSLAQSLNENMAAVYGVTPNSIKGYGTNRAKALLMMSEGNKPINFDQMDRLLCQAWRSLHQSVQ